MNVHLKNVATRTDKSLRWNNFIEFILVFKKYVINTQFTNNMEHLALFLGLFTFLRFFKYICNGVALFTFLYLFILIHLRV